MGASWRSDHAREAIERLSQAGLRWDEFSTEMIRELRRAVGFDGWCAALTDPTTRLPALSVTADSPVAHCQQRFWQLQFEAPEAGTRRNAAVAAQPVAVLSKTTDGDLARSRRWDELLRPAGTSDELRAELTIRAMQWGSLVLYRAAAGSHFSADDQRLLGRLHAPLSSAARASWTAFPAAPADGDESPATLVTTPAGTVTSATPAAGHWLARFGPHPRASHSRVFSVLGRLAAETRRNPDGPASASLLTRTIDGRWAELRAAPLSFTSSSDRRIAITIGLALPSRVRAVLSHAYGLSERERQVAGLAMDGRQAADIAAALYLSPYTVRDHLKTIFRKTGCHTRQELAARLGGYEWGGAVNR